MIRNLSSVIERLRTSRLADDRRGNIAAIVAIAMVPLLGSAGLGVDIAQWVLWKRNLQGAADAAAMSAAQVIQRGGDTAAMTAEATKVVESNNTSAFIPRSLTAVTRVASPGQVFSAGQTAATHGTSVRVVLAAQGQLYFAGMFLDSQPTISVNSLAGPRDGPLACFLALGISPSFNDQALEVKDATVSAPACRFHSNSSNTQAFRDHGNGSFTGSGVSAVGGITGVASPTPVLPNSASVPDPYGPLGRNLQAPTGTTAVTRCPGKVCPNVAGVPTITPPASGQCIANNDGSNFTINTNVRFEPGVYLFCGGSDQILKIEDGNITGAGVSIVLRGGMRMEVNGNANLNLQAMTTTQANTLYPSDANRRALAGMLFWQVNQSIPSDKSNFITGNITAANLRGAFYSPHTKFELHGNLGAQGCMQLVAEQILIDGNANITLQNNCAALTSSDPAFTHFDSGATGGTIVMVE